MQPLDAPGALWVLSRAGKVPRPPADGRNLSQGTGFLWMAREKGLLAFSVLQGFASAEATKGLSDRPLETFGAHLLMRIGFSTRNGFLVDGKEKGLLAFSVSQRISPLRRRPKGFPIALWKPSGWLPAYKHFCSLLLLKFRDKSDCKKPHCSAAMWLL